MPPGVYSVSVSLRGFGRQTRRVELGGGSAPTADFALEPRAEEEVTVTAMLREQTLAEVPSPSPRPRKKTCGGNQPRTFGVTARFSY